MVYIYIYTRFSLDCLIEINPNVGLPYMDGLGSFGMGFIPLMDLVFFMVLTSQRTTERFLFV